MHIYLHEVQEQAQVSVGIENRIMITTGKGLWTKKEHQEF